MDSHSRACAADPKKLIPEPVWGETEELGADSELRFAKQQRLQSRYRSR
jgi:hypothetical protein